MEGVFFSRSSVLSTILQCVSLSNTYLWIQKNQETLNKFKQTKNSTTSSTLIFCPPVLSFNFCKLDRMHIQSGYSKSLLKVGACQLLQDKQLDTQKQLPDLEASQRVVEKPGFPFFIVRSFVFIHHERESWGAERQSSRNCFKQAFDTTKWRHWAFPHYANHL